MTIPESNPLLQRLREGPLIADGAMGTMVNAEGFSFDECFDGLNLANPEVISRIHRAYIAAGAELIEANTYGANRFKLEPFGLESKVAEINRKGVKLAREEREISGRPVWVAGSIGPTGRTPAPIGTTAPEDIQAAFTEQALALLEGGVDCLSVETMPSVAEFRLAVRAAREATDLPVIGMLTFTEDGVTPAGDTLEEAVGAALEEGVDVIGANCSVGPRKMLGLLDRLRDALRERGANIPVSVMPNAGWPTRVSGRVAYPSTPEYFAEFAAEAVERGASLVGGCCGTTPAHVAAMRQGVAGKSPIVPEALSQRAVSLQRSPVLVPADGPTDFTRKLGNKFVVAVEIDPPKGLNPQKALDGARLLKAAGVDVINVADSPMARVRMSAMTMCYLIQHEVGIETIIHFTTRDRSLMGLQSELLGAHAAGIRNVLALTGDPPNLGDYPDSSAVYDVDSIGLLQIIGKLNNGTDSAGASIGQQASFTAGCAVDPTRADLQEEASRLRRKLAAGAQFIMTQPIFDVAVWRRFLEVYGEPIRVPVIIGILPLQSSRHAEFLHNEVPGITLSDAARERMRLAGAEGRREGVAIAQELLLQLQDEVQGVYLMPSFGRYEVAAEVLSVRTASAD